MCKKNRISILDWTFEISALAPKGINLMYCHVGLITNFLAQHEKGKGNCLRGDNSTQNKRESSIKIDTIVKGVGIRRYDVWGLD